MQQKLPNMDIIVVVLARKLQYFEKYKVEYTKFVEYEEVIKCTIANMDYFVFLTNEEKKTLSSNVDTRFELDGEKLRTNFMTTLKKIYPNVYPKLVSDDFQSII